MNSSTAPEESKQNILQYECNICLDIAFEPVITPCGHLFCWPCIYSWLNSNQEYLTCPVCKNGCTTKSLIPIYTKHEETEIGNSPPRKRPEGIPPRPFPERSEPQRNNNAIGLTGNFMTSNTALNLQSGVLLAGPGLFPSLFNLLFQYDNKIEDNDTDQVSPEVAYQPMLRKALYVLIGIFVLMILMY